MEKWDKTELLNELYNLILSKHIRTFERQCLLETKNKIEIQEPINKALRELEVMVRSLALRYTLPPMVTDFYHKISNDGLFGTGVGRVL